MSTTTKPTTTPATEATTTKAAAHSPCTLAAARCRLAAIAAIAEVDAPFVAAAYAEQARHEAQQAEAAAADDKKDARTVQVAWRWVGAAKQATLQKADWRG